MRAEVLGAPESWERHTGAACAPLAGYRRRGAREDPSSARSCAAASRASLAAGEESANGRGLAPFVERYVRTYIGCGILGVRLFHDDAPPGMTRSAGRAA